MDKNRISATIKNHVSYRIIFSFLRIQKCTIIMLKPVLLAYAFGIPGLTNNYSIILYLKPPLTFYQPKKLQKKDLRSKSKNCLDFGMPLRCQVPMAASMVILMTKRTKLFQQLR